MTNENIEFYGKLLKLRCFSSKEISEKFNLDKKRAENLLYSFKEKN